MTAKSSRGQFDIRGNKLNRLFCRELEKIDKLSHLSVECQATAGGRLHRYTQAVSKG